MHVLGQGVYGECRSFSVVSDETHKMGSYLAVQASPSDQTLSSFASTVAHYGKELPQEVTEIVRETIMQLLTQVITPFSLKHFLHLASKP